jgi:hypothetical protein
MGGIPRIGVKCGDRLDVLQLTMEQIVHIAEFNKRINKMQLLQSAPKASLHATSLSLRSGN